MLWIFFARKTKVFETQVRVAPRLPNAAKCDELIRTLQHTVPSLTSYVYDSGPISGLCPYIKVSPH